MPRDTTVAFRQPEAIDDPLSEVAREGARRMLAQVLIAEANLCRHGRTCIAGWPRPHRASWPWAASCNPDRSRACRGPSRQSARPGRRGRRGENPLHLVDSAEVSAADEESRCAAAGSLPAWGVDRRLPGGAHRPPGQGRAEPLAGRDHATHSGVAGGL